MKSYKEWQATQVQGAAAAFPTKVWKMDKDEILRHWAEIKGNLPLVDVRSIPPDHAGSTYRYDGIRITGSAQFIDSCISRLKDLLRFEGEGTRLQLVYRQQQDNETQMPIPESFVFYVQVHGRGSEDTKDAGLPGVQVPKLPPNEFSAKI